MKNKNQGAMKELLKMMKMSNEEMRTLLHMVGGDWLDKEPGWRNYAVLPPTDKLMESLIKKRLVKCNGKYGDSDHVSYSATTKGLKVAKVLYWANFGKNISDNKRKDLKIANARLYNNGLDPVIHE